MNFAKKLLKSILCFLLFFVFSNAISVYAFSGGGSGTDADPYIITNWNELDEVRNEFDKSYKLGNDIDLNNAPFIPIATFTGNFNGDGYTVYNLKVTSTARGGLFGSISNAMIQNLNLKNVEVDAGGDTGGLVGFMTNSTVQNCSVTGDGFVKGKNNVGGLVGNAQYASTISKCYSTLEVSGQKNIGGLCGETSGANKTVIIDQCYATGAVTGTENVGGLVAFTWYVNISDSFALGSVSGTSFVSPVVGYLRTGTLTNSYGAGVLSGTGLIGVTGEAATNYYFDGINAKVLNCKFSRLTSAMKSQVTYNQWDFTDTWQIDEGASYPYLKSLPKPEGVYQGLPENEVVSGTGIPSDPYIISTKEQLNNVRYDLRASYKLINDIDLENNLFTPIMVFTGDFNGNRYKILNLKVSTTESGGLFGSLSGATIQNLKLENVEVDGGTHTGGLVGYMTNSTVRDCSVTGDGFVKGKNNVGGLVGKAQYASTISKCYSTLEVSGQKNIGGLCGEASGANKTVIIDQCYATGAVTGTENVGGLVAYTWYVNISDSFALGSVSGTSFVSPVVGYLRTGTLTNSYGAGVLSGTGLIGVTGEAATNYYFDGINAKVLNCKFSRLTSAMKSQVTYNQWDFTDTWQIDEGASYPYLKSLPKPEGVYQGLPENEVVSGTGIPSDPYIISTKEQLNNVRYDLRASYKLINDIDLENNLFTPIMVFTGDFNGNRYKILNLKVSTTESGGLFGSLSGATIQNLKLENVEVDGGTHTGGLVGYMTNSTVQDCSVTGDGFVKGKNNVGGLVGNAQYASTISKCYSTLEVSGQKNIGGLCGETSGANKTVIIDQCYATGAVTGTENVGGLVAYTWYVKISDSFALGSVSGTSFVSPVVGYLRTGTLTNSYGAGALSGTGLTGVTGGTATNYYFDMDVAGISSPVAHARTTTAMMREETFKNWDFNDIWGIDEGSSYPYLRNLTRPGGPDLPSYIEVLEIILDQSNAILEIDERLQLIATVLPENATNKNISWSSSDNSIATVDANGMVTAISKGTVIITATTYNGLTAVCEITVNPAITIVTKKINDTDSRIRYNGNWTYYNNDSAFYNSDEHFTKVEGESVEFTFNGPRVSIIGATSNNLGIMDVYVDNVFITTIDLYSPNLESQKELFEATDLSIGQHTIKIVCTGNKNPNATDSYVTLDAIEYDEIETDYNVNSVNDTDSSINYVGNWTYYNNDTNFYMDDEHYASAAGDYAEFTFTGTMIRVIGATSFNLGEMDVYIDGVYVETIDLYSTSLQGQKELFALSDLSSGAHTVKLVCTGNKNQSSSGCHITVDKFEYE